MLSFRGKQRAQRLSSPWWQLGNQEVLTVWYNATSRTHSLNLWLLLAIVYTLDATISIVTRKAHGNDSTFHWTRQLTWNFIRLAWLSAQSRQAFSAKSLSTCKSWPKGLSVPSSYKKYGQFWWKFMVELWKAMVQLPYRETFSSR